jgi:AraC-like DNA-binding protein
VDGVGYREFAVAPAGAVECGWSAAPDPGSPPAHAVLPDGAMDLVWTGTALLVAGPDTAPHPARREPGATATGLRFRPGALPALLGVPADALRDQRVALAELRPDLAARAVARLEDGAPAAAVLGAVLRALPGRPDRAAAAAAARLGAGASAAATADALGWTTRTLHRRSLAAFGYGPAVLRRVLRFRRAVDLLHAGASPAETAARAGFADQPHLSREVRALAGASPAQLARRQPASGA